jgi:hypothetical protein
LSDSGKRIVLTHSERSWKAKFEGQKIVQKSEKNQNNSTLALRLRVRRYGDASNVPPISDVPEIARYHVALCNAACLQQLRTQFQANRGAATPARHRALRTTTSCR